MCGLPVVICRGLRTVEDQLACPRVLCGRAASTQFSPLPVKAERPRSYRGVKSEVIWASHSYPEALPISVDNTAKHRCRHKGSGECRNFYVKTIKKKFLKSFFKISASRVMKLLVVITATAESKLKYLCSCYLQNRLNWFFPQLWCPWSHSLWLQAPMDDCGCVGTL